MDWKKEAIEILRQYRPRVAGLSSVQELLAILEADGGDRLKGKPANAPVAGGSPGPGGDAIVNNLILREELEQAEEITSRWISLVESALARLEPEERQILERFFLDGSPGAAEDLQMELGVEKTQIYARKKKALQKFTYSFYGILES